MKLKDILGISIISAGLLTPIPTCKKQLPTYKPQKEPKLIPLKIIQEREQIKFQNLKEIYWDAIKPIHENYC